MFHFEDPEKKMKLRRYRRVRGFTLLEMLVVLVIIGLIASLVGPRLFSRVDSSKVQVAETQARMLRGAVETYRLEVGRLPRRGAARSCPGAPRGLPVALEAERDLPMTSLLQILLPVIVKHIDNSLGVVLVRADDVALVLLKLETECREASLYAAVVEVESSLH